MSSSELSDASFAGLTTDRVEQALKQALDHAAEGIHWVGPDGTILWANQTELDLLGYSKDEYLGRHIAEFHLDGPCIEDILSRLTRGETLHHYPARLRHKDGSVRHVEINSRVLWDRDTFLRTQCFTRDVTGQRAADEAARRLAEIVENSDDAIFSQDLAGTITSWNKAAERLYGFSAAEAIGQSIKLIIPEHLQHEERAGITRIARGERVATFDTIRLHKNGSGLHVAMSISPLRDRDGRVIGASKIAGDISARKRLEAQDRFLLDLDDTVRVLSDPAEITFAAAQALGRHLKVNRCAYAAVAADQDTFDLTGNFTDAVPSIVGRYTFRQFGEECLRLMRAGEPYVVDDSAIDPRIDDDDRVAYVQAAMRAVICVPVMNHDRLVAAMAVHANTPRAWESEEVSLLQRVANRCWESIERARVTQDLRNSEARFRSLASTNSALTLYEQDRDLRYTWVFPSHAEFASDNIGKTDDELLPPAEGAKLSQLKREVLASGAGRRSEITVTLPNDVRTYDLVIEPRHDADGAISGIGGVAVDITERKQNELRLARAEDAARESEARLRDADRRKDEFLAMLAHELRNPLAPIRTGLRVIGVAGDTAAAVQQVRPIMERQLAQIVRLVDDLLDVSRITSGKIRLQRQPVALKELVDGAIEANRDGVDAAGVTLDVDLTAAADCRLLVDPTRTVQVLSNVVNNAVKFTGRGGRIAIRGAVDRADGTAQAVITVTDNGAGIPAAMLPRLFDLFEQGDHGTARAHGGLGIGLALARTLIEMHGGTIDAHSDGAGRGSTFTIRIPATATAAAAVAVPAPRVDAPAARIKRRVLVVDDNEDSATVVAMLIHGLGSEAQTAPDGETALQVIGDFSPEIVLLDIGLPGIDGYETCRRIRRQYGASITLVAITGWGQVQDKRRAREAGFDAHLTKPADPLALEKILATPPAG